MRNFSSSGKIGALNVGFQYLDRIWGLNKCTLPLLEVLNPVSVFICFAFDKFSCMLYP